MTGLDTQERILDAAENLFSDQGVAATSLRAVTARAGVNLAAVHYHFGPKTALLEAVLSRRLAPINQERLEWLDRIEAAAGDAPPPLEDVIEAFVAPAFRDLLRDGGAARRVYRLIARFFTAEPESYQLLLLGQFREVIERFACAVVRALPDLPRDEVLLRFEYAKPILAHALTEPPAAAYRMGAIERPATTAEANLRRAVAFLAAGLRAPITRFDTRGAP